MAIIVPEGFLSNPSQGFADVREHLLHNAKLQTIVSLPRGAFEPYNRTKTNILYFTDVRTARTVRHYWWFNVKNDGYTLDKRRRPTSTNDLELVLSETTPERESRAYLLDLGIEQIPVESVAANRFILSAAHYRKPRTKLRYKTVRLGDIIEAAGMDRVGDRKDIPILSITQRDGLVDQSRKFHKRVASSNISGYRCVYRDEMVVGFPVDEGVLGFQFLYPVAAVSPAYSVWRLRSKPVDVKFLDLVLRSQRMRHVYELKMQGAVDRRRSIPKDVFLTIEVPMPPASIREKILDAHSRMEDTAKLSRAWQQEVAKGMEDLWV